MSKKYNIETYTKLEGAAQYFLNSSFDSLDKAMREESLASIYYEELMKIEISEKDKKLFDEAVLPTDPVELLQSKESLQITGELMNKFISAQQNTDRRLQTEKIKFNKDKKIGSLEMLGALNNFGFFIETLINRHLLFLSNKMLINKTIYNRISVAKIMERIIYLFKDEINGNSIRINEIINLFSLRNKTVHFTPDNANALKVQLSELYRIWAQTIVLFEKLEEMEKFNGKKFSVILKDKSMGFQDNWN